MAVDVTDMNNVQDEDGNVSVEFVASLAAKFQEVNSFVNLYRQKAEGEISPDQGSYGVYLGYCVDTLDIYKQNRIRFFCPLFHKPDTPIGSLPFAMPITSFGGIDDCGANWVPPAGSTVALVFEGGDRLSPFYLGTTWTRLNGSLFQGEFYSVPMAEYDLLYQGQRGGYLCGPNNGTQLLPPWNTESYNGFDITSIADINNTPNLLQKMTFPNIYGFKTPQKHMMKMVDGDPKCNQKWKRIEILSGCGNWLIMKDDHLHYCGQWAHPVCGAIPGDTSCQVGIVNPPPQTALDANGVLVPSEPSGGINVFNDEVSEIEDAYATINFFGEKKEDPPGASVCGGRTIGGDPDYPGKNTQVGANPFFKQQSECRPYTGPQTPQNNKCDLPQTGIQLLSISGHTFVMDDSVQAPEGGMEWQRSTQPFSFGCTNKFLGRTYWRSTTGHQIMLDDSELLGSPEQTRSQTNGIQLLSALGNSITLCDSSAGPSCPSLATEQQGISMVSTSGHTFTMSDNNNDRQIPCRKGYGASSPENNAKQAYVRIRTGYGTTIEMYDGETQKHATDSTYFQITSPQIGNSRGPHIIRLQERETQNGYVYLRAGGDYRLETFGGVSEIIGIPDNEESVGNKVTQVKNNNFEIVNETKYQKNNLHLNISDTKALVLAGKDYNQKPTKEQLDAEEAARAAGLEVPPREKVPNVCPVLVFDGARGLIVLSDRFFASASPEAPPASIFNLTPLTPYKNIQEFKKALKS
jgi:hypothetical protein